MLISIAGNIGVGKSSVTALLHEHYGWKPLFESVLDNPYLEDFYSDMERWAYQSQLYFLCRQCSAMNQLPEGRAIAVQDRSIYEDAEIFSTYLYDRGYIDDRDYKTYTSFYQGLLRVLHGPRLVVYLRAGTDALIDNIRQRGRLYEQHIDRAYIEDLNVRYDAWAKGFTRCPIHTIEAGNYDFFFNPQAQEELIYTIRQLVQ